MRLTWALVFALLRQLIAALTAIGGASCAHLLVVAASTQPAAPFVSPVPPVPSAPLTQAEQREWADLVARLVADA